MKALLVDDDEFALKVVSTRLKKEGFETVIFQRGREALEYLDGTDKPPGIILLDIIVPDINGFELLTEIRKRQKLDTSKVFVYSSLSTEQDKRKAMDRGANGYFSKKYEGFEELVNEIKRITVAGAGTVPTPAYVAEKNESTEGSSEPVVEVEIPKTSEIFEQEEVGPQPIAPPPQPPVKPHAPNSKSFARRIIERDMKRDGFTLVEILVVIGILGLLIVIPVVNFQSVRQKRNDDERINELNLLHGALRLVQIDNPTVFAERLTELFSNDECIAASPCISMPTDRAINNSGWVPIDFSGITPPPIDNLPVDPKNTGAYIYQFATNGTEYELRVCLESESRQLSFGNKSKDNGSDDDDMRYEVGTDLSILNGDVTEEDLCS